MGNQARRRAEVERARRRRSLGIGAVGLAVALAAGIIGWRVFFGDGDGTSGPTGWTIADVRLELVRPDDPQSSEFEGHGYRVMFDGDWRGATKEPPPRALPCALTVRDPAGAAVYETEFGLFIGTGEVTTTWTPTEIRDDEPTGMPAEAELSCEKHATGAYRLTDVTVVRGWIVTYVARWTGAGEPAIQACEVDLVDADDPDTPVLEEPLALAPRHDGAEQSFVAPVDELTFPPADALLDCDLEDDQIIDE